MKVQPEFLPEQEQPRTLPFPQEAIPDLLNLQTDYHAALSTGDPVQAYQAREKLYNFLVETELLTPDRYGTLDPESQKAVDEAKKLTLDFNSPDYLNKRHAS